MGSVRTVLDLLSAHALELDSRNRVRWMSRAALAANGLTAAEVRGQALAALWPAAAAEWLPAADAVRRSGEPATRVEYAETCTGRPMYARVTRMPAGPDGAVLVVVEDCTTALELAATQTMLRALSRAPLAALDTIGLTPRDLSSAIHAAR